MEVVDSIQLTRCVTLFLFLSITPSQFVGSKVHDKENVEPYVGLIPPPQLSNLYVIRLANREFRVYEKLRRVVSSLHAESNSELQTLILR